MEAFLSPPRLDQAALGTDYFNCRLKPRIIADWGHNPRLSTEDHRWRPLFTDAFNSTRNYELSRAFNRYK